MNYLIKEIVHIQIEYKEIDSNFTPADVGLQLRKLLLRHLASAEP